MRGIFLRKRVVLKAERYFIKGSFVHKKNMRGIILRKRAVLEAGWYMVKGSYTSKYDGNTREVKKPRGIFLRE